MKKIALYLFLLFSLVQFGPGVKAIFSAPDAVSLFNPDEEKNTDGDKTDNAADKKTAKKEFIPSAAKPNAIAASGTAYLHRQDAIAPAPLTDILTPPPNQA